ncbi:MAG TPA: SagB family peptide dehydrogenase [Actinophytocola sp.]|nr:SagB family peptide dehydrogenase [Actinophytocola sp.]
MPSDAGNPPPERGLPLWSFRDDVALEPAGDGGLTILTRWGEVRADRPSPAVAECLHRMTLGPVALTNVAGLDLGELLGLLARLPGCVVRSLGMPGSAAPLLSVTPVSPHELDELPELDDHRPVRLSRFAALREQDGEVLLESPLSHHRVVLHRPLASWVVGSLGRTTTSSEIARVIDVSRPLVTGIVTCLAAAGMVVFQPDPAGGTRLGFAEDSDPALLTWSPHDLMFHSRSRIGRHDDPVGALYRYAGRLPPLPAVKPPPRGERFPLYRPDPAVPAGGGITLTEAMDRRRSVREFAADGPSADQLGELLHRTARIRSQRRVVGAGGIPYTVSERPYPSMGSLHELELYLTVDRCAGLPRGIYHYDPQGHALTLVNVDAAQVDELLGGAMVQTGSRRPPPVLITMTARMARLSWVHGGISYATTLKHVGVLQQTLYLVATALGLAPCALAMGDSDAATAAFGLDHPAEVSVGEFVVGLPVDGTDRTVGIVTNRTGA